MSLSVFFQQHVWPHKLLSRIVYAVTRCEFRPFKTLFIRVMTKLYDMNVDEAASASPDDYPHFNAWFTRALKPGARVPEGDPRTTVVMPADGRVSQLGRIEAGHIFQAKDQRYTVEQLLASAERAQPYHGGSFITVYLSPRDYHRVHMPFAGRLLETVHVPGRLFSVAPFTVEAIPELFARNERVVCHFETEFGPMAVVLVGAMLVSGVETVWGGVEIPPYATAVRRRDYQATNPPIALDRAAELGRFNMGSTVIVLVPDGVSLEPELAAGAPVRLGQALARIERGAE
jgi:phosphatidylserine decarboxylase